jgi:hypothetical protein
MSSGSRKPNRIALHICLPVTCNRFDGHNRIRIPLFCVKITRRTTVNKDKGKVIQIFLLATSESVESKINIILVEFMLKGIMRGALLRGFSWALVMSTTSLIRVSLS